ncbi:MAG: DNA repair protein RecO C-terminal domain-containing protein [Bacteroidales bacterium]|nr:DNA repair protein RecO C-terminal domain-containing protein [Bacteroidales bacterium]
MLSKIQIVVLHTIKHGDNGVVIQCYSNTAGRTALYLRVSARNRVVLSNLHRLNILDVVIYNNGSSMPVIRELAPAVRLDSLRTNIYKSTISIFLSELLVKCVRESEENIQLYNFLVSSINVLEHMEEGISNFHIHFMVHICKLLGFMPTDNYSLELSVFDVGRAMFREPEFFYDLREERLKAVSDNRLFTPQQSQLLHELLNTRAIDVGELKCSGDMRLSFAKQMLNYISHHLGITFEVKSLDILHQVFN